MYCRQPFHPLTSARRKRAFRPVRSSPASGDCRTAPPRASPRPERRFVAETWGAPADRQEEWVLGLALFVTMLRMSGSLTWRFRKRHSSTPGQVKERCETAYGYEVASVYSSYSQLSFRTLSPWT